MEIKKEGSESKDQKTLKEFKDKITHNVSSRRNLIFEFENMLMSVNKELFDY